MPTYSANPGVDWGQVAQAVSLRRNLEAADETAKANAIRWQGQQDYQTLIGSGVDPVEALRRTAHKLYFNSPAGMASALRTTQKVDPEVVTKDGIRFARTGMNSWRPMPDPKTDAPGELIKEEFPPGSGQWILRNSKGTGVHVINANKDQKNSDMIGESARLQLLSRIPALVKGIEGADPKSNEYRAATNAIAQLESAITPKPAAQPPVAPVVPPPTAQAGLMPPTNAVSPVTAPVATGPVQVKTQSEYDALPKGVKYIRADGKVAIKK